MNIQGYVVKVVKPSDSFIVRFLKLGIYETDQ